jgi:hypothetical protein
MGAAPALAKDTTSVKLAGKVEKAATAKSKVLISIAQNKAMCGCEVEMPLQEGKHMYKLPPEMLLQKCECEHA